jgi:predicted PurR-regulated permease PerM
MIATVVLATLTLLAALWIFRGAVGLLMLSVALSLVAAPIASRLHCRYLPWPAAVVAVYAMLAIAGAMLAYTAASDMTAEMDRAMRDFAFLYEWINKHWAEGSRFERMVADHLPPLEQLSQSMVDVPVSQVANRMFGLGRSLMALIINAVIVVVLSIYWTIDMGRFRWFLTSLVPYGARSRVQRVWQQVEEEVGRFLSGELIQSLAAAAILMAAFHALGFPYATTLAVIGALAWLVPWLGPAVAVMVVWLATGLNWIDVTPLAAVIRGVVGSLLMLTAYFGVRLVVGRRLADGPSHSSLINLVVILALVEMMGAVGLLLGSPLAVALQVIGRESLRPPAVPQTDPHRDVKSLKAQLDEAGRELASEEEGGSAEMQSLVDRLGSLLEESRQLLNQAPRHGTGEERRPEPLLTTGAGPRDHDE